MKTLLIADWNMTIGFCNSIAGELPNVHCIAVTDKQTAINSLNPPPDLIITQPALLDGDFKAAIEALDAPPPILFWGDPKQRKLAAGQPLIELPVNFKELITVIRKKLFDDQKE